MRCCASSPDWPPATDVTPRASGVTLPPGRSRFLTMWYSSPLEGDPSWITGFRGQADIWKATLDLSRLGKGVPPVF
jgi:hypothetical protein